MRRRSPGGPAEPALHRLFAMDAGEQTEHAAGIARETVPVPQYHVVLLDDDHHSYDYVIEMLGAIFGYDRQRAFQMAVIVDTKKRVVVETTYLERAELRRGQIHAYGPDWRIPGCAGSMSAVVEPAG